MNEIIIIKPDDHYPSIPSIPEPSITILFLVGLALICLLKWRKQFHPCNVAIRPSDLYNTHCR